MRIARLEAATDDIDRAVLEFQETAPQESERYDGLVAIDLFVSRTSGMTESAIRFDGLQVLRRRGSRFHEIHGLCLPRLCRH